RIPLTLTEAIRRCGIPSSLASASDIPARAGELGHKSMRSRGLRRRDLRRVCEAFVEFRRRRARRASRAPGPEPAGILLRLSGFAQADACGDQQRLVLGGDALVLALTQQWKITILR